MKAGGIGFGEIEEGADCVGREIGKWEVEFEGVLREEVKV